MWIVWIWPESGYGPSTRIVIPEEHHHDPLQFACAYPPRGGMQIVKYTLTEGALINPEPLARIARDGTITTLAPRSSS